VHSPLNPQSDQDGNKFYPSGFHHCGGWARFTFVSVANVEPLKVNDDKTVA
jgi:hypothetical protein